VAYDETLAGRLREIVADIDGEITERKMFGGLAFMLNGHMFTGASATSSCSASAGPAPKPHCDMNTPARWTSPADP